MIGVTGEPLAVPALFPKRQDITFTVCRVIECYGVLCGHNSDVLQAGQGSAHRPQPDGVVSVGNSDTYLRSSLLPSIFHVNNFINDNYVSLYSMNMLCMCL